jgi:hypothetical protein
VIVIVRHEIDAQATAQEFVKLQDLNRFRNAAVTTNLKRIREPGCKLAKLFVEELQAPSWADFIRQQSSPGSRFILCWDLVAFALLIYFLFAIPYRIAFLFGEELLAVFPAILAVDFCCDLFWLLDLMLKARLRPFVGPADVLVTDPVEIFAAYRASWQLHLDLAAALPLELLSLLVP